QTKAPLEQVDVIVRGCRVPDTSGPAKGSFILDVLKDRKWMTPDEAVKSLWKGALVSRQEDFDVLPPDALKFRAAVLIGESLENNWTPPPPAETAEEWRKRLSECFSAVRLTHKILALAKVLKLDTEEHLKWGLLRESSDPNDRFQRLEWLSPDELPIVQSSSDEAGNYAQWGRLLEGLDVLNTYPLKETIADPNVKQGVATAIELALKPNDVVR